MQGQKGEDKNDDPNAGKKEENDIEMEGDFEGQMYSREEQQEDDEKSAE